MPTPGEQIPPISARTLVTRANIDQIVKAVAAGQTLVVNASTTGYTRHFQHQDWVDFVDPVQAGGGNGFNERFHALEQEFDLIAAAIQPVDDAVSTIEETLSTIGDVVSTIEATLSTIEPIGLTIATFISDGAQIPIPSGFSASECQFFAFPMIWDDFPATAVAAIGFTVYADGGGKVNAPPFGRGRLTVTGVAVAKKGGW